MAAFDNPLNDKYLSFLHEARAAEKAARRAASQQALTQAAMAAPNPSSPAPGAGMSSSRSTPALLCPGQGPAAVGPVSALLSPSSGTPSASLSSVTANDPLSSAEILTRVPTPVLRVLAHFGPAIHIAVRVVRLATWTGGKGSTSGSFLLLLAWWAVCLFGYEVLRYAPQAPILGYIAYRGIVRASGKVPPPTLRVTTAASINATLEELAELADFASAVHSALLAPFLALLSWEPWPSRTRATATFLLVTWPAWLACFVPWATIGLPRLVLDLPFGGPATHAWVALQTRASLLADAHVLHRLDPRIISYAVLISSHVKLAILTLIRILRIAPLPEHFSLPLLPPWPLGSLTLRSALLMIGTVALTWSAPWAALLRHAAWRSAAIRRTVHGGLALLSFSASPRTAFGRGHEPDVHANSSSAFPSSATATKLDGAASSGAGNEDKEGKAKVTRTEDVVLQFGIYENQRWWVGLDWTAALLPQERPAWSDESNNAVSPPSSFSLPPAKTTLTPAPTASDPGAYNRRLVTWQWLDPEWTVAGAGFISSTVYRPPTGLAASDATAVAANASGEGKQGWSETISRIRNSRASNASIGTASASNPPGSPSASSSASGATLFSTSGMASRVSASATSDAAAPSTPTSPSTITSQHGGGSGSGGELGAEVLHVDAEGWEYGDNSWEKLSRKAGMGKYTRRRKWVRRAVLVEIVEHGIRPEEKELRDAGLVASVGSGFASAPAKSADGEQALAPVAPSATPASVTDNAKANADNEEKETEKEAARPGTDAQPETVSASASASASKRASTGAGASGEREKDLRQRLARAAQAGGPGTSANHA